MDEVDKDKQNQGLALSSPVCRLRIHPADPIVSFQIVFFFFFEHGHEHEHRGVQRRLLNCLALDSQRFYLLWVFSVEERYTRVTGGQQSRREFVLSCSDQIKRSNQANPCPADGAWLEECMGLLFFLCTILPRADLGGNNERYTHTHTPYPHSAHLQYGPHHVLQTRHRGTILIKQVPGL